jgi:NtrC-family two-component system sensor histidine kinase KinB
MVMIPGRLRLRFVLAAGLLVVTTVIAGVWTFVALSRLTGVVTDTVRQSEAVTAVTATLAGALEREDDAVLLILAGDRRGTDVLAEERRVVDRALGDLFRMLGPADQRELADPLRAELSAYRAAADTVITVASEPKALVQYHQQANPVLRRSVNLATVIRDAHFERAREAVTGASDEATAARRAVLLITLAALGIAVVVAWHLTRTVVGPLRRLTRGANAIREGEFAERIEVSSRDELGELASAFNQMAEDLAEFRRTNINEVVRAKNALEATLEALPDAVVLLNGSGRIQSMNRTAVTMLDAAGVFAPQHVDDLRLEGFDPAVVKDAIAAGVHADSPADLAHTIRIDDAGAVRRLLPRVVPVPTLTAEHGGAVLLLYDVTELARLDEMRSELVAVASHELQTPLTTLRMTLLMMREGAELLPKRQQDLVTTSLIGVEQLTEIVHEFLDLARIEAGELRLSVERFQVSTLIAEVVRRFEAQAAAQRIMLDARIDSDVPRMSGDPIRLRAVFDNIVSNALKYTAGGGSIVIHARVVMARVETAEQVSISITDTGIGIPAAFRSRVFDKFFRLEHHVSDTRPPTRGVGIGLYMCRQIVELHGGAIACESGPEGRGTCITVTLPVERAVDLRTDEPAYAASERMKA